MSTTPTLCQGLQSCVQPLLLELRVLMHQLVPPKPLLSFPWPYKQTDQIFAAEPEKAYSHPFSNSSLLGAKSLDMCTESLGTETGSGIDQIQFPYHPHSIIHSSAGVKKPPKVKRGGTFPPPLTSGGVQVQTHREAGRLVITAFAVSSSSCRFQEERGGGRLRLSLIRDGGDEEEEEVVDRENIDRGGDGRLSGNEEEEVVGRENADGGGDGRPRLSSIGKGGNEVVRNCGGEYGGIEEEEEEVVGRENAEGGEDGGRVGCVIGGGEWSSSRCNGDRSSRERLQSLPFCVAIS